MVKRITRVIILSIFLAYIDAVKAHKTFRFKSFVDPTKISFPTNMVGVVGPNGCGKSNVIDAIRWVLGELSAKNLERVNG